MSQSYGTQISEHLYRVAWWDSGEAGVVNCDVFAIDYGEVVVLIDSGRGGLSYASLKDNLAHWGLHNRLTHCFITHMHQDHAGGIAQLQADGVSVCGGRAAASFGQSEAARECFGGRVPSIDIPIPDHERMAIGRASIMLIDTPGHTSTCVSYLTEVDGCKCAFVGDLVMPHGTIGYSGSFDFSADQLTKSLTALLEQRFDALLTGHMLASSQPEGFWMRDGKSHVRETLEQGLAGKWVLQK